MRLPEKADKLVEFSKELIDECRVSIEERRDRINTFLNYYYSGSAEGAQVTYNRCYPHIDRLASFLFSPTEVRFSVSLPDDSDKSRLAMAETAQIRLNEEYHRCNLDLTFASCVQIGLVKGCALHKKIWGMDGIEGWIIHPERFGVLREDISDLDRQEAFVQTDYFTRSQFWRMIMEHPRAAAIFEKVTTGILPDRTNGEESENQFAHQIILSGVNPVGTGGAGTGNARVGVIANPTPQLDPKVQKSLIRVDELWVVDSKMQDWTTIKIVGDELIEGGEYRRNLSGLYDTTTGKERPPEFRGSQPFTKVCPNEVDGYFWGQSEIANVYRLQDDLNTQWMDLRDLTRKKADPSRVFVGFSGMTQEKWKALKRTGGYASEENPTAKIETLAPDIPPELFTRLDKTLAAFDDVAGFQPILQGQGQPGVRSEAQAQTLVRNASPRMRDRALLVERQCVEDGEFCLKLLQAKKADYFKTTTNNVMLLKQLTGDYRVSVDSHTSSPAFQEDAERKAFALHKAGAIGNESLIKLTHPPHEASLIALAREAEAQKAKLIAEHPELLLQQQKRSSRR